LDGAAVDRVRRLQAHLENVGVDIRLGRRVAGVRRLAHGVELRVQGDEWELFDDIVLATHSDVSLSLLSDASREETAHLSAVRYQPNRAVTHSDASLMPKRRICWASWNYTEPAGAKPDQIGLTYWMNRLQPSIPADDPIFVTLNPQGDIPEDRIYDHTDFSHPVYDLAMLRGVEGLRAMNGTRNTWFCGAWMHNGFHEDGFRSAVDVAEAIGRRDTVPMAAE
ncbi:MAG: cyclopropane-fatty-acyl-phospholipid synthase, partial [Pseudomonadota bacterium]